MRSSAEALDRIEGKLDTLVSMVKGGAKALPQPTIITEADVDDLALDLADGAVILPRGAVVSKVPSYSAMSAAILPLR